MATQTLYRLYGGTHCALHAIFPYVAPGGGGGGGGENVSLVSFCQTYEDVSPSPRHLRGLRTYPVLSR